MKKRNWFKIIVWDILICGLFDGLNMAGQIFNFKDAMNRFD